jgi:hypothetical protein
MGIGEKLASIKRSLGKQANVVTEADLEQRAHEREVGATLVAAREEEKRSRLLAEKADKLRRKKKQALSDSFFGGSIDMSDPNAGLASFVQRIIGGGASGNDASKMVIQVVAKDVVESSSGNTNQEKPPSTRFRFFTKPKPMETTIAALNNPKNKTNLDKLPRKK